MITKNIPGFCFLEPKNRNTINFRLSSVALLGEDRAIRAVWTPELAQDLMAFHNIDAEAELTALLTNEVANEIDRQIIQDIHNNGRFYQENHLNEVLNRWNRIMPPTVQGHRAPADNLMPMTGGINIHRGNDNPFDNIAFPMVRRVAAQTVGLDLVATQPLTLPNNLLEFIDYNNYQALPNEEGWFTKGTFESLMIKMDMKPFRFILPLYLRNRRNRRRRV